MTYDDLENGSSTVGSNSWAFETKQIHSGATPDPATGARATPIYQTTSYVFEDTAHAADLFSLVTPGNIYTRINNPTQDVLEQRVAALEGGVAAVAVASGQAATVAAILTLASTGDHLVSTAAVYGGTYSLFMHTLPRLGIEVTLVEDSDDMNEWHSAVRPNTKLLFCESIGNPYGNVIDIAAVADVAHKAGVPLVVDNTIPTPFLLRPLEYGADVVVHSATKHLGGHGTTVAGVVVDGGRFDFGSHASRFPEFIDPDPSYHGMKYWEVAGCKAFATKLRVQVLRNTGPAIAPFNSFLILQGIETLSLRMERHSDNALKVAEWLEVQPEVEVVHYAGLESSSSYKTGLRYLPRGAGGIVSFELTGNEDSVRSFVDGCGLFSQLVNIGDVRSLIVHPASTTHSQLSDDALRVAGITPGLIRLSVGLEDIGDILCGLDAGFQSLRGHAAS